MLESSEAQTKERRLIEVLHAGQPWTIAFSGGVDSTYLLAVAQAVLGPQVEAATADAPSLPRATLAEAEAFCRARGIVHHLMVVDELSVPEVAANTARRCFHCRGAQLAAIRAQAGPGRNLAIGAVVDDLGDYRPGLEAARQHGVRCPLVEVGLSKAEVRLLSRQRGLATWNRPAEPCLSSRIPYGEPITRQALQRIEQAEAWLHAAGFRNCRARHHRLGAGPAALCRIEVPPEDQEAVLARRQEVDAALRACGFQMVCLDLAPLRSGEYNLVLLYKE